MATKLYVGSLAYSITDQELNNIFSAIGAVTSATVIKDRDNNNRSKGFGFVEMESSSDAARAIKELNGSNQSGRTIAVSEAKPETGKRGGGGGRGGDFRGGDRGGRSGDDRGRGGDRGGRGGW